MVTTVILKGLKDCHLLFILSLPFFMELHISQLFVIVIKNLSLTITQTIIHVFIQEHVLSLVVCTCVLGMAGVKPDKPELVVFEPQLV